MEEEQRELLYRIDERTESIDKKVDGVGKRVKKNEDDIDELQDTVRRNSTIIGGVGGGITALMVWAADKVTRLH